MRTPFSLATLQMSYFQLLKIHENKPIVFLRMVGEYEPLSGLAIKTSEPSLYWATSIF